MCLGHKSAQIIRRPIKATRRKQIDPIVTPAVLAWKISDRHHLDHANSDPGQLGQFLRRSSPGAFLGKRANMHFVNNLAWHAKALPLLVAPAEARRIDHTRRSMGSLRLKT